MTMTAREREAALVLMAHRVQCVPFELVTEGRSAGRVRRRDDLDPGMFGEGCVCNGEPLKVRSA